MFSLLFLVNMDSEDQAEKILMQFRRTKEIEFEHFLYWIKEPVDGISRQILRMYNIYLDQREFELKNKVYKMSS